MAISPLIPIVQGFELTTAWQDVYTVPDNFSQVGLDKVTVSNYSANNVTYSVRIVPDGTATISDEIITEKKIKSKRADLAPELIVHALSSGTVLQMKANIDNAITVHITATQIS